MVSLSIFFCACLTQQHIFKPVCSRRDDSKQAHPPTVSISFPIPSIAAHSRPEIALKVSFCQTNTCDTRHKYPSLDVGWGFNDVHWQWNSSEEEKCVTTEFKGTKSNSFSSIEALQLTNAKPLFTKISVSC